MAAPDRTVVTARGVLEGLDSERIDASTATRALAAIAERSDLDGVCAVLKDDMDRDDFVALVSVLVVRGVQRFDTAHPQIVQRILDTHSAIAAGEIEVLEP